MNVRFGSLADMAYLSLHSCIGIRVERIETITEMIQGAEEYANFKDYKLLIESASFTIDHQARVR